MSTAKKALTGTFFVAINSYLSLFIYFIAGIFLARLLNPSDFGIYRIALFLVDLFSRFKEFGLDQALIHKQEGLDKAYRAHFTLQIVLATLGLIISLIFAPLIISRYSPAVFSFIILISISYIFQALGSTQRISLEKNLLFKRTTMVDVVSLSLSSLISVVMAFNGFGALSLVAGYCLNIVFATTLLWIIRPWKVPLKELLIFEKDQLLWFLKFGFFLFIGGLTTFILYKYNDFVLGTFLSVTALGFYSRAFNYAQIPTSLITSVVSKVALPTYSSLQNEKEKLSETFFIVLKSIVRISFPLSLVLYLVADDFTVFVLGNKWSPMVPIFRILLIYGVLRSVFDDLGGLFTAVGKPKIVSVYLLIQALAVLIMAPVLTNFYKASGAAISLSIALALGVVLAYTFLRRIIKIKTIEVFLPTIIICVLTLISFKLTVYRFNLDFGNPLYSLVSKGLVFSLYYFIFMLIIDVSSMVKDVKFIYAHIKLKELPLEQLEDLEKQTVEGQI